MNFVLLFLHVVGATIWTGGHIVLSLVILPRVLRENSLDQLLCFESAYEKIGIPALFIQIISGFLLAHRMVPDFTNWFDFSNPVGQILVLKIILLLLTIAVAMDARLRILPNLCEDNLKPMARHIIAVTLLSILFIFTGVSFRTGWGY